jgi:hypothetical protein
MKAALAITDVKCHGEATGRIEITRTDNGTAPYGYALFNSEGTSKPAETGAAHIYSNLPADTYKLTITDSKGCHRDSAGIVITQPETPVSIVSAVQTKLVSCDPGADGVITVEANGGTGALTYSSDGAGFSPDNVLGGLAADTEPGHTVTVRDANACTATATVPVRRTENPDLSASAVTDAMCYNDKGSIIIHAVQDNLEGSSLNTMSQYWITGVDDTQYSSTPSSETGYSGLNGGKYELSARDSYGCTGTETVTLAEPANGIGIDVVNFADAFGSINGSVTVRPKGGYGEYTVSCLTASTDAPVGSAQTGGEKDYTFSNLPVGSYKFVVKDIYDGKEMCTAHTLQEISLATGEPDPDAPGLKIFPNPSSDGRFLIEWDTRDDRKVTLEVYTTSGKLVYKTNVQTGTSGVRTPLDISGQSRGTYLLRVPELDIKQKLVVQ